MNEHKAKKMRYGFYNEELTTQNPLWDTESGTPVRINEGHGYGSTIAWLIGESENFKEKGCYDVVEPDEGMRTVHWDHLRLVEGK